MRIRFDICVLWVLLLMPCLASGEYLGESPDTISTSTGFQFYSRTLEEGSQEETVQQSVLPLLLAARIAGNLQIRAYQTLSNAQLDNGPSLNGLENTRIRGSYTFFENALAAYLGLSVPVDSVKPVAETAHLSNILYREVLDFGVNEIAEGLNLDFGIAYVQPFGGLSFGLGMGYLLRGSYDRLSMEGGLVDYNPGNVVSLSAGFSSFSRSMNLGGKILYVHYGDSKIEAENAFENNDEISFVASLKPRFGPVALGLLLADTVKVESSELEEGITTNDLFRNRLSGGLSLAYSLLADTIILKAQAGMRFFFNDAGVNAKMASLGSGFRILLTDDLKLDFSASLVNGEMDSGATNISGFDLGVIAGYGF